MATAPLPVNKINKVNVKNMNKLIEFLKDLDRKKFNFDEVVVEQDAAGCGTVCCAVGWFPTLFPEDVEWNYRGVVMKGGPSWQGYEVIAANVLNLDRKIAGDLFEPSCQKRAHSSLPTVGPNAYPKTVAKMLEKFMKLVEAGKIEGHGV